VGASAVAFCARVFVLVIVLMRDCRD